MSLQRLLRHSQEGRHRFQAVSRSFAVVEKPLPRSPARLLPYNYPKRSQVLDLRGLTRFGLAAHDKMSVPLELSDLSRNQLWRQIRGFSRSPLGKASTKGKLRSDPSTPAHRHKLAVFPHKVVDGNRGQREGDDGRDTNTTNAGPGQADLVRPLATATVCSVSGLRIGTVLGGEPHGPGSPWIVKMMTATEERRYGG